MAHNIGHYCPIFKRKLETPAKPGSRIARVGFQAASIILKTSVGIVQIASNLGSLWFSWRLEESPDG
jgi:hypothetical protein